jgi:hypothetical protein
MNPWVETKNSGVFIRRCCASILNERRIIALKRAMDASVFLLVCDGSVKMRDRDLEQQFPACLGYFQHCTLITDEPE